MQLTSLYHPALSSAMASLLCAWLALSASALQAAPAKRTTKALKQGLRLKQPPRRRPKARKKANKRPTSRPVKRKTKKQKKQKKKLIDLKRNASDRAKAAKQKKQAEAAKKKKKKAKKPKGKRARRRLTQWLALGPGRLPMPAFHREKRGKYTHRHMLMQRHAPVATWEPRPGQKVDWLLGRPLTWRPSKGRLRAKGRSPQAAYLATYIDVPEYTKLKLKLRSHQRLRVFLDGRPIATKSRCTTRRKRRAHKKKGRRAKKRKKKGRKATPEAKKGTAQASKSSTAKPAPSKAAIPQATLAQMLGLLSQQARIIERQARIISTQLSRIQTLRKRRKPTRRRRRKAGLLRAKLTLTPGIHTLIVKTLYAPGCVRRWGVWGQVHHTKKSAIPEGTEIARTPYRRHSLDFYFYRSRMGGLSISPDGQQVVVRHYKWTRAGRWAYWLELRNTKDGKLIHSSRPYNRLHGIQWAPDGKQYSFVSYGRKGKRTLWLAARKTGKVRALLRDVKRLGGHRWAPNSKFIVYYVSQKEKATRNEKIGAKRLRGMDDRYPSYRVRSYLYAVSVKSGLRMRLTAGKLTTGHRGISADSKRMLLTRTRPDYRKRPFHKTDLYELDLRSLKVRKLIGQLHWLNNASYSPDGTRLLLLGGPSMLGHLGRGPGLKAGVTANDYEGEAYIYHLKKRSYQAISRRFVPHIASAYWHPIDGKIYITALNKSRYQLFQYDPKSASYARIPTDVDLATQVRFARNSSQIVYLGQGIRHPNRLYTLDLFSPAPRLLLAPNKRWLSKLTLAKVKDFVTTSRRGHRIEGRVYTPPNFDPRKKYPAIVYYYGGTFPTPRYFDGAYSGQLWAAHGYVTYILQPSGAIGYGQRFAARHVNEWGTIVPEEIIDATKDFIKAHPFVDGKRVGCTGASYGGFTTMSIVTKTKLFAAAISHAGISNITSYWGAGFWGFWYSAVAGADRYPWSHPYFYVKQSPLFFAHKVTTPLLLLHGTHDNNVPASESYQMYTALRLLQKKVELVLFNREGHGVRNYRKRIVWVKTILAWFEKQLKKKPLWWEDMYGKRQY